MPKISIIIPVRNVQDYLHECLDSILGQTFEDLEVICVDDASEDSSASILQEYAQRDERMRVITFSEHGSASRARKDAVAVATGDYIMFVDADDSLELDACERLHALVQERPVDILHFGTAITDAANMPAGRVDWMQRFVTPYDGELEGADILEGGFAKPRLHNFNAWGKLFSAELCRQSFSRITDTRFPRAEDKYAYFLICYYAKTYRGVPDLVLYHYNFGRGSTGHELLTLTQFQTYCAMVFVADAIKNFLAEEDALDRHASLYHNARDELLLDCVGNWDQHLSDDDIPAGFDLMLEYWKTPEVLAKIATLDPDDRRHIADLLKGSTSMRLPKISIVIPVHNMQDYLRECLDSVLGQTLEDIEVICVDDASEDSSAEILRHYAQLDERVRVITYTENRSASQARKDAVAVAAGAYIMFIDSDDSIEPDACERLYATVQAHPVDILHFGTSITNEANLPESRVERMQQFVEPHDGVLQGRSIFECCFSPEDKLYNFNLWDKLYSADLCKKSFARVKDGSFPKAQDKYAYFILSYYAQTYMGVPDLVLYHYHFGRGVTGHNLLSMPGFERYCSMALVANAIRDFLVDEGSFEQYETLCGDVRNQLLTDCAANWTKHLGADDKARGFDLMMEYWEAPEVIAKIAELNFTGQGHIARLLKNSASIVRTPRKTRVVGTYYHRIANGGTQRVLAILIKLWRELGYEVVLFTDVPASEHDYDLPKGVRRVVLPSFYEITRTNYIERARAIDAAIREYKIDVMVYHAWVSRIMIWDLLACRAAGAAFISHAHNAFSMPARSMQTYFADMPAIYHLCDAILVLSDVDHAYWSNFNSNVVTVVNPFTFSLDEVEVSTSESKNILWLGRISTEKRPHDALKIFAKVLDEEPDARLIMVGDSPDEQYMESVITLAEELGIQDSVDMHGFHKDVLPFYGMSAVFLMTSEYEGFSLVLAESQSVGIPCVMYDLPYLALTKSRKGFVAVEMGDLNAAADALVSLLRDPERRKALGREARANIESLADFDFGGTWTGVFDSLAQEVVEQPVDETTRIMWETLLVHYRTGAARRNGELGRLKKQLATAQRTAKKQQKTQKELQRVRASWAFRVGYALTALPRNLKKALRRSGGRKSH